MKILKKFPLGFDGLIYDELCVENFQHNVVMIKFYDFIRFAQKPGLLIFSIKKCFPLVLKKAHETMQAN